MYLPEIEKQSQEESSHSSQLRKIHSELLKNIFPPSVEFRFNINKSRSDTVQLDGLILSLSANRDSPKFFWMTSSLKMATKEHLELASLMANQAFSL